MSDERSKVTDEMINRLAVAIDAGYPADCNRIKENKVLIREFLNGTEEPRHDWANDFKDG